MSPEPLGLRSERKDKKLIRFDSHGPVFEHGEYWTISLPHQCDRREFAGDSTLDEAKAAMWQLIAEAQAVLDGLERGEGVDA